MTQEGQLFTIEQVGDLLRGMSFMISSTALRLTC